MTPVPQLHSATVHHVGKVLVGTGLALAGRPLDEPPRPAPSDLHKPTLRALGGMLSQLGAEQPAGPVGTLATARVPGLLAGPSNAPAPSGLLASLAGSQ
jgi:hypothetical protein